MKINIQRNICFIGEYLINSSIIIIFTPFIWIIIIYFASKIFKALRIRTNSIISKDEDYIYYRGDLDKIASGIIMFTSTFDVNIKKSISATILKLRLTGYIEKKDENYVWTNKDESTLPESEKMVLDLIRFNTFDKNKYRHIIEKETLKNKYIIKHRGGIQFRIIKIIIAICIPIVLLNCSINLDRYTFENYHVYPDKNGKTYIELGRDEDIEKLYNEIKDKNDYYYRYLYDGKTIDYSYDMIRADKFEYSIVRKAFFFNIMSTTSIIFVLICILISLYNIIQQFIYMKKSYRRTIKGKMLLNKAYALKNYLKKYSLIHERKEEELILWEYYLIYAIVLNVNIKIEDEIIEKYVDGII